MFLTATGTLRYDPNDNGSWWAALLCGHGWYHKFMWESRGTLPQRWTRLIDTERPFDRNHATESHKTSKLALVGSACLPEWGPHISIVRGETPTRHISDWGRNKGVQVEFEYDPQPYYNADHVWLTVRSEELVQMREFYGLSPVYLRDGNPLRLHLTIAVWDSFVNHLDRRVTVL